MTRPSPFMSRFMEIEPDWIDYNNHLNMGYYTVLFDRAADEAFDAMGFGPDYVSERNHTTFSAEFHVCYLREVKLGDRVRSSFRIVAFDEKRFHSFQELYHEDGWIAATGEGMTLHVDLGGPKVAPMPPDIFARISAMASEHAKLPAVEGISRKIAMPR